LILDVIGRSPGLRLVVYLPTTQGAAVVCR
jgi:hypothetical protein